jgi:hypothetical protein
MKELNADKMEILSGGSQLGDIICLSVAGADLGTSIGIALRIVAAATGITLWTIIALNAACLIYAYNK